MQRTQDSLIEDQKPRSESRRQAAGCTVSELGRASVERALAPQHEPSATEQVRVARRAAGAWKGFPEAGADYVERIRGSKRLTRMMERS